MFLVPNIVTRWLSTLKEEQVTDVDEYAEVETINTTGEAEINSVENT